MFEFIGLRLFFPCTPNVVYAWLNLPGNQLLHHHETRHALYFPNGIQGGIPWSLTGEIRISSQVPSSVVAALNEQWSGLISALFANTDDLANYSDTMTKQQTQEHWYEYEKLLVRSRQSLNAPDLTLSQDTMLDIRSALIAGIGMSQISNITTRRLSLAYYLAAIALNSVDVDVTRRLMVKFMGIIHRFVVFT